MKVFNSIISLTLYSVLSTLSYISADSSVHEIGYFNLVDIPMATILCENIETSSCPNFLVLESGDASTVKEIKNNEIKFSGNFLASVISTIGSPANIFSYYTSQVNLQFNSDNITTFDYFDNSKINALYSASGSVETMAYVIDEVFEFRSVDGSGIYNVKNDKVEKTINYSGVVWNPLHVSNSGDITHAIVSSKDNRHNFTWTMSGDYIDFKNGTILTPIGINLDTFIEFPFEYSDTFMALRMFVCGANAEGGIDISMDASKRTLVSDNSKISWNGAGVSVSADVDIEVRLVAKDFNIMYSIIALMEAGGSAKAYCKVNYYSFNSRSNTVLRQSISYGVYTPGETTDNTSAIIISCVVGFIIIISIILVIVTIRMHYKNKKIRLYHGSDPHIYNYQSV